MSFRTGRGRAGKGRILRFFVYTSYPSAELFVNGKSYGKQRKLTADESRALEGQDSLALQRRYRLMWMDVPYEPGEVKVVAYDASGKPAEEKVIRTAGKPHHLELVADRTRLSADGKDLAYITVRVVDKDGNLCPADSRNGKLLGEGCRKISCCCQWRCYQPRFVPFAQDAGFQRSADGYCAEWRASR